MTHSDYLAVFDWNSTLLKDIDATTEATNQSLHHFNIAPLTIAQIQEIFTFPLIHFYEKAGVNIDDYLKDIDIVGNIFNDSYNQLKKTCPLMDGAIDILTWLREHDVTCKILSNYNQIELEEDVARLNITKYFDSISGNLDPATIVSGTNKYERLRDFIHENGFRAEKTFIIGDSHEEPELARKLDILGISIAGGLLSPARLAKYKKDYVIESLYELPDILSREWNMPAFKTKLA